MVPGCSCWSNCKSSDSNQFQTSMIADMQFIHLLRSIRGVLVSASKCYSVCYSDMLLWYACCHSIGTFSEYSHGTVRPRSFTMISVWCDLVAIGCTVWIYAPWLCMMYDVYTGAHGSDNCTVTNRASVSSSHGNEGSFWLTASRGLEKSKELIHKCILQNCSTFHYILTCRNWNTPFKAMAMS